MTENRDEQVAKKPISTPLEISLETERLILRPVKEPDSERIYQNVKEYDIARWAINIPHPYPKDGAISFIKNSREQMLRGAAYHFAIVLKNRSELVGVMSFIDVNEAHRNAEIGYWVGKTHWGDGIATEAATRMLAFGFEELNLERISARCFTNNLASRAVMEKAGMMCEGTFRHEVLKEGEFIDLIYFAVIKEDWRKRQ